jgi:hypothetical protein
MAKPPTTGVSRYQRRNDFDHPKVPRAARNVPGCHGFFPIIPVYRPGGGAGVCCNLHAGRNM